MESAGGPLPLLCKPGDPAFETFDARRFQFFLYSAWRHFLPDHIVSPEHCGFQAVARFASKYFSQAFAAQPQRSAVVDFLAKPNRRGLGGETQARLAGNPFVSFPLRIQRLHAAAGSQTGSGNHCHR